MSIIEVYIQRAFKLISGTVSKKDWHGVKWNFLCQSEKMRYIPKYLKSVLSI